MSFCCFGRQSNKAQPSEPPDCPSRLIGLSKSSTLNSKQTGAAEQPIQPSPPNPSAQKDPSVPNDPAPSQFDVWEKAELELRKDPNTAEIMKNASRILKKEKGIGFGDDPESRKKLLSLLETTSCELKTKNDLKSQSPLIVISKTALRLKDGISATASSNLAAGIACGVLLIIAQLALKRAEGSSELAQGLKKSTALIPRIDEMQSQYLHPTSGTNVPTDLVTQFNETLTSLCAAVQEFQARALCYLEKSALSQNLRGMFEEDPWTDLIQRMESSDREAGRLMILIGGRRLKERAREKRVNKLLEILYTGPFQDRKDINPDRVPGTCEWFTRHKRFQGWRDSSESCFLWVSADPGCGKSVLAKYLIDEVLPAPDRTVCYFFFKDDDTNQKAATSALASLLRQLIKARPSVVTDLALQTSEQDGDHLKESFQELWNMLISFASRPEAGEVIFVIDALDECCDNELNLLIKSLTTLYLKPKHGCTFKFLATSRPYEDIRCGFRELEENFPKIRLSGESDAEVKQISQEINLVVEHMIKGIARDKGLDDDDLQFLSEQLKTTQNQKIQERTYLWVTLTLGFIKKTKGFTRGKVRRVLGTNIPQTVYQAYEKILGRISDHERARRLLHIILAAERPLSLEELSVAEAVKRADQTRDEIIEDTEPVERFKTTVRDLCGLLLCISDNKVYLLHQTLKTFLVPKEASQDEPPISNGTPTWEKSFPRQKSNSVLGEICIWLIHSDLSEPPLESFLVYASLHWYIHLRASHSSDDKEADRILFMAVRLCTAGSREYERWTTFCNLEANTINAPEHATSLMIASWLGILGVVEKILRDGSVNIESTDSRRMKTALSFAAQEGHSDVVKLLLENGATIDSKDAFQQTPLSFAAEEDHLDVVKLLLEKGADRDSRDIDQRTPLLIAARRGYSDLVDLFLGVKAEVEAKDKYQQTPLSVAAWKGHSDVVKLLVGVKVDLESKDNSQRTALSHAARHGCFDVVKLLLEAGAEVDSRDKNQQTPLSRAARLAQSDVVDLLLQSGATVDSRDGYSVLRAAERGQARVRKLLLEAGSAPIWQSYMGDIGDDDL
ncbi:hypothetical protein N7528_004576 [Penicillium herquei]|nr:hypothetical protein N7528_004576 [Penicillium herquei]